jgi:hypothetical protein
MSETLDDKSKRSERWKNTLSHPMKSWLLNIISPLLWFRSTSYIQHDSRINHHFKNAGSKNSCHTLSNSYRNPEKQ